MTYPVNAHLKAVELALMELRDEAASGPTNDTRVFSDELDDILLDVREAMELVVCPHNASPATMSAARERRQADPNPDKPRRRIA